MTNQTWQRIRDLLDSAQKMPPEEREGYLDEACAGDPALRSDLRSLVRLTSPEVMNSVATLSLQHNIFEEAQQKQPEAELHEGDLISHYQIIGEIGRGGMGVVYRARDKRLGRDVALKILPAKKVSDPVRLQRFLREARAEAMLNHPNIVTVYDVGSHVGVHFIAMEFVEGKTLAQEIPMDPASAMLCARQMASALAKAHAAGITHRDLKPANVMLTADGTAKVLDFGLAKLDDPLYKGPEDSDSVHSRPGMLIGTPTYMSPEQAQGQPADAKSDIFSFGSVLYEMLSGKRAFKGDSAVQVLASIIGDTPQPLRELIPEVWPELDDLVSRCLKKKPEERFQDASHLERALLRADHHRSHVAVDRGPTIAVLPFTSLSGDKENEYFSDGLAEEIINALGKIKGLSVTARTSSFVFKGKNENVKRIGQELNVGHIIEGSVRKSGNRIRVTAQLVAASDGCPLWSERYDRELTDIFDIQDEISQAIVDVLKVKLASDQPATRPKTDNMEAYQAYMEGRYYLFQLTAESMRRCRECLERAIQLDPDYALPHSTLAEYYYYLAALMEVRPRDVIPKMIAAAEAAIALDPSAAEAYASRAVGRIIYYYDWQGAASDFAIALKLNPSSAYARFRRAMFYLRPLGRLKEAIAEISKAMELDPLSVVLRFGGAHLLFMIGEGEQAIKEARAALELFPDSWVGCWLSGNIFHYQGMDEEAETVVRNGLRVVPENSLLLSLLTQIYRSQGKADEVSNLLAKLDEIASRRYVSTSALYLAQVGVQNADQAFERLVRAIEDRDPHAVQTMMNFHRYWPANPKFAELSRMVNLDPTSIPTPPAYMRFTRSGSTSG